MSISCARYGDCQSLLEFLIRLGICLAVVTAGFALLVARTKSQDGLLWMLFPVIGCIPGAMAAALIFVPIERYARSSHQQWIATPAVVLAGSSIVLLLYLLGNLRQGSRGFLKATRKLFSDDLKLLRASSAWMCLGAIWGALWRLSASVTQWIS